MKNYKYNTSMMIIFSLLFTTAIASPPLNLTCAKSTIKTYYQSGEFEKDVNVVVQDAEKYLAERVEANQHAVPPRKLAIVLDIDDTSLSNFTRDAADDFSGLPKLINARYRAADAIAIQPVLRLYREAIKQGVSVIFITFRPEAFRSYTIQNLHTAGYADWTQLYMPSHAETKQPAEAFKSQIRKELVEKQGYDIILNLGDQDSDLAGGYTDHTDQIPNPLYSTSKTPCADSKMAC